MDSRTLETGFSLLTGGHSGRSRVLWITLLNTPREVVDIWDDHCPARPDRLQVVLVGDGLSVADTVPGPHVGVHTVDDPADLTTLGVRVLNALSAVEADDEDEAVDVCLRFDSLTPLSQYVSREGLGQFLHVLTTRLADAGVRSHFHLDPMAHDSQTVHALGSIFDTQVRVEDDGVSLTHR
ncbi:hypothetical protein C2R22_02875 [Salinigranum rubrum]|uniref:Uncharacterized protein n=1 Tax=Salinigranum rubrum TaxID=755307 RepID=A0A2I8VFL7_9EURY|nr:hypothetical protein [Salinigranum rubrum]AUV80728.1 hypothetical protein C2R22_02875 [Salinigranum rubrum]